MKVSQITSDINKQLNSQVTPSLINVRLHPALLVIFQPLQDLWFK